MKYLVIILFLCCAALGQTARDFQMDEGSGTAIFAEVSTYYYGTLIDTPTWAVDGNSVEFDGTNYIEFADNYFDFNESDFTVTCSVKSTYSASEYRMVWGNFDLNTNGVGLFHSAQLGVYTLYTSYIGNVTQVSSAETYDDDEWHTIICYRDTTTLSINVDTNLDQTVGTVRPIVSGATSYIGTSDALGTDNLVGSVGYLIISEPLSTTSWFDRHGSILIGF